MRRRHDPRPSAGGRCRRALLAAWVGAAALAQQAPAPIDFRTPDGSRFVLLPDDSGLVHWAIATPAGPREDVPGQEGLAEACVQASLLGTWAIGSRDPQAERMALTALDEAATALAVAPRVEGRPPAELQQRHDAAEAAAAASSDIDAFARVLATAPAAELRTWMAPGAAIVSLTTTAAALERVATLLVERREQQPLRRVLPIWNELRARQTIAWDANPLAPLRAELLALAFAGSSLARVGERPGGGVITRAQAEACWQRTQRPDRTVQVLIGGFDAVAVRALLAKIFATTALPQTPLTAEPAPARLKASRRSQMPGARQPMAAIAWQLTGREDGAAVAMAAKWLAGGPDSWLAKQFHRLGRSNVVVSVSAPWPAAGGAGLFLLELSEPGGRDHDLAEQVLKLCDSLVAKPPAAGQLDGQLLAAIRDHELATQQPRLLAERLAADLLVQPGSKLPPSPPRGGDVRNVPPLLTRILASQPVVVASKAP